MHDGVKHEPVDLCSIRFLRSKEREKIYVSTFLFENKV